MTTVILIIVFVGIALLIGWLRNKATKALTQKVFLRGSHARGQAATQTTIDFFAPVPPRTVLNTVVDTLELPRQSGGIVGQLWLAGLTSDTATFAYGNKLGEAFRSALVVQPHGEGGSKAHYSVLRWVEGDGIVHAIAELDLLANSIRACAGRVGASYVEPAPGSSDSTNEAAPVGVLASAIALADSVSPSIERAIEPAIASTCRMCGSGELGDNFCTDCGARVA